MKWPVAVVVCLALALTGAGARAADWPGWRGPTGQGICAEKGLPLEWSAKTGKNVLWKSPLPRADGKANLDQNQSSPVVSRGRVFVTVSFWPAGTSVKNFPEHHVACYRVGDGKQLWDVKVAPGPWSRASDLRGGYTVPTPAADGERVFVVFGSSVIAALDYEGKQLWRKEIRPFQFDVALGSSPVLYRDTVLLQLDGVAGTSRLAAYDRRTGDLKWERKRPVGFSHSTPVLTTIDGRPELLVAASNAVQGVDPDDGSVRWWCRTDGDTVSPVQGEGLVYCDGGRGGKGVAVAPGGKGDVTKTRQKWQLDRVAGGMGSPVVVGGQLYRLTDPGVLRTWKMADGSEVYSKRLEGVSSWSSPFTTPEGRIYCASAGRSYVVKAGPKPEVLAVNDLGDGSSASPAVADGRIYLKGRRFLWCVGNR
jgi:outer membrane protein assembly factor BamB